MDANSPEDAPLPGYSVPIRAPLTIDSDSEFGLSVNDQIYSRTNSFNSSSSSIDISSYSDEHTSVFEEERHAFVPCPDDEFVIQKSLVEESCFIRPFVRYPDGNYVKESCGFSESAVFRAFVKIPCEESSSGADFGSELSVPIAPLTRECDSDTDIDSVDGCRSDDSGWCPNDGVVQNVAVASKVRSFNSDEVDEDVDDDDDIDSVNGCRLDDSGWTPADGVVQKVIMAPEVRSFNVDEVNDDVDDELQVEGVFSGDDIIGIENLNCVSTGSIKNEACKVECLNEDVKLPEPDASIFDLESVDAPTFSSSNNETETINGDEADDDRDDELHAKGVFSGDDLTGIENFSCVSTESIENEGHKVGCLNEVVKLSEPDASSFDLESIDAHTVSSSNNETETETINEIISESDEPSFDSERNDAQVVSNSETEIEILNSVSTIKHEGCKVECLNEDGKLSESDVSSFDLERIDAQTVSSSNNETESETINATCSESDDPSFDVISNSESEIEIKTENETEQEVVSEKEVEMLTKMQRVRAKFLRLAINEQLTTKVNGEGGNYNFDFNLTVLAIGKTGVGKSATVNSIFGEKKATTSAFDPGTTTIQEITGNVDGIQLRVIDTPGLKRSSSDRSYNLKILKSIKRFTRKHTPNVVLYVDRLDTQDVNDSHLLTLITSSLGPSVWHSCIIALTHASCESCDPVSEPSTGFVVQRCRFIQQQIVRCGGNSNTRGMANRVWLVDNKLSYEHDVMDLDFGLNGLVSLDQANEDDGCYQGPPFEPVGAPRDVISRSLERNKAYFAEDGYRVKLLGNNHWSIGCRLCI